MSIPDRRRDVSDDDYTNMDLDTADELLVAAGRPELVPALRSYTQGMRNLVQGEWGIAFVNALDSILGKHINPLTEQVAMLRSEVATRLGKLEQDTDQLKQGQVRFNRRLTGLNKRHEGQIGDLTALYRDLKLQLEQDEQRLDRKRQELDDHATRLARIEAQLGLDGDDQ